ncbi:MAG TPA: peptidoglycan -binding protein [Alphaproteobacteria bacterium]
MAGFRRTARTVDIWPGFVDALATLILVVVFMLMVFTLFQFYLKDVISGRDQALAQLSAQLGDLADQLALERRTTTDLRQRVSGLSDELQTSITARERLEQERATANQRGDKVAADLEDAYKTIEADKEKIDAQLGELDALRKNIETLTALRAELEKKLNDEGGALASERELSKDAQARADLLTRQIATLQQQIAALNEALGASETKAKADQVQIADLGKRLNSALAGRVEELSRFRSEFFGRLRQVLGERQDVRVVGDRFVFQSEVLFPSGSAELQPEGQAQLDRLADALGEIAQHMPADLPWVLQVDGHTDRRPISTPQFPSNWELSTARAISVVKYLASRGVADSRLAAAGFGEFQPIDPRDDEIGWRRNRRIEVKVTSR